MKIGLSKIVKAEMELDKKDYSQIFDLKLTFLLVFLLHVVFTKQDKLFYK